MTRPWYPTRLRSAMQCQRKHAYEYEPDGGRHWRPRRSYKAEFGDMLHQALAMFDRERARGNPKAEATAAAIAEALTLSHQWTPVSPRPVTRMTRRNLVRAVVWYCDDQPATVADGLQAAIDARGEPMLEVEGQAQIETPNGQRVVACKYDVVGYLGGVPTLIERKTTEHDIGPDAAARYTPDVQIDVEDFVANNAPKSFWPGCDVIIEFHQIAVGFSRWYRWLVQRTPAQRRELEGDLADTIATIEANQAADLAPMNRSACSMHERKDEPGSGCPFRAVCARDPSQREAYLAEAVDKEGRRLFERREPI